MRQVPRSPLSFKLQRVANVPEHPPPSTRLMSCAHIANRRLSRIIGARRSRSWIDPRPGSCYIYGMALTKRAGSHAPAWAFLLGTSARLSPGLSMCAEYERQLGGGSPLSSLMAAKD